MEDKQRQDRLEEAFLDGPILVSKFKLRPFSLGTLSLARRLSLTLFTGPLDGKDETPEVLSDEEMQRQMVVFAWMQSAPLNEVLASVKDGSWKDKVEAFEFELEVGLLPSLLSEVSRIAEISKVAAVDVQKKPGDGTEKDQPGNS